jgi:hypothetical protein
MKCELSITSIAAPEHASAGRAATMTAALRSDDHARRQPGGRADPMNHAARRHSITAFAPFERRGNAAADKEAALR